MILQRYNFGGGINQLVDPAKIDPTQYYLLINARNRRNKITPINQPLKFNKPIKEGKLQGIYAFNTYLLLISDGLLFYKLADSATTAWTAITGINFSALVDRIYAATVPASSIRYSRISKGGDTPTEVNFAGPTSPSDFAAVIMDGVSQPGLVFPDASCRLAQTYDQWTLAKPEYVPVATLPMSIGSVLYCVMKDKNGRFTQIVRSVSGQPINFVIPVDVNGNKTDPIEGNGGALATSFHVDFNELKCLKTLNAFPGSFFGATDFFSYLITPDFTKTIFGEPTFKKQDLFSIGAVNNDSVTDMLGDTGIIFPFGITTFNAVTSASFAGKNSPFSAQIQDIIGDTQQTITAATTFNNYGVFAMNTRYGPGILWFDQIQQSWTAIDLLDGVGAIKQFAVQSTPTGFGLFFIDDNDNLYQYFAGNTNAKSRIYFNEVIPQDANNIHHLNSLIAQFTGSTIPFDVELALYVDRLLVLTKSVSGKASMPAGYTNSPEVPIQHPLVGEVAVNPAQFNTATECNDGYRIGVELAWTGDAELLSIAAETEEIKYKPAAETSHFTSDTPITICFIGGQANNTQDKLSVVSGVKKENPNFVVDLGNISRRTDASIASAINLYITPYWTYIHDQGKYLGIAGSEDNTFSHAEGLYAWLRQPPPHYSVISLGPDAEIYLLCSGVSATGGLYRQTEVDNFKGPGTIGIYEGIQQTWIANKLAASTKKTKIVAWSWPQYSSLQNDTNRSLARLTSQVIDWKSLGATCLVCGEIEGFEHINQNGFNEFNTAGCLPGVNNAVLQSFTKQHNPEVGYLKATIYRLSILWEYMTPAGQLLYRFRQTY